MKLSIFFFVLISLITFSLENTREGCHKHYEGCKNRCKRHPDKLQWCYNECRTIYTNCLKFCW